MSDDWKNGGFGLYVHWPFCAAKCPYCDFNSHVSRSIDQSSWADAYEQEIARWADRTGGRVLNSIFFGGGTPSLMEPFVVSRVIEKARSVWRFANDVEITLEANPTSVEASRFAAYRDAGVNRVSLGVQALEDRDLKRLGRTHSVAEAMKALDVAQSCFDRVSFDLIYARQDQGLGDWKTELDRALSIGTSHLSLYQLTIEPGTAFGDRYRAGKLRGLPVEALSADMFELTQDTCVAAGLPSYEVSNHARPSQESRHNLIYWRYGDYLGIGPGAHGRVTFNGQRHATESLPSPAKWLDSSLAGRAVMQVTPLSGLEQAQEYLLMGMRKTDGIAIARHLSLGERSIDEFALNTLADAKLIIVEQDRLKVTKQGLMLLDSVVSQLHSN